MDVQFPFVGWLKRPLTPGANVRLRQTRWHWVTESGAKFRMKDGTDTRVPNEGNVAYAVLDLDSIHLVEVIIPPPPPPKTKKARIAELEAALTPFADMGIAMVAYGPNDDSSWAKMPDSLVWLKNLGIEAPLYHVTVGMLRAAARAMGWDKE